MIQGWDIGIGSMAKGERAVLTCTGPYAYGPSGAGGVIPPNATLHFDVEVLGFGADAAADDKSGCSVA